MRAQSCHRVRPWRHRPRERRLVSDWRSRTRLQQVASKVVATQLAKAPRLLRLAGMENLAAAESLVGASIWMAKADLPELDDEQYYWSDLEGLEVVDQQQGVLGRVVGMFATAAHDILEVDSPAGEILIPAIEPFLVRVDRDAEQLHVNLPEGLVPEADQ